MKVVIVGMGIQGNKRKKFFGKEFVYSVDKFKNADFKSLYDVPIKDYDAVLICVPDKEKIKIINYCIKNKKHILVEKPLISNSLKILNNLKKAIKKKENYFLHRL